MRYLLFVLSVLVSMALPAQDVLPQDLFGKCFNIVNEKSGKEKFKGQILKGKRNGMGYILYKNGDFYAGDFYRNDIKGFGLYMAAGNVKNCADCKVYVGNWSEGKKSGFGVCYGVDGEVIYKGQFADDKPSAAYPSDNKQHSKRLSLIQLNDGNIYLGEVKEGLPEGFGVIAFSNGDLWQSSFKNGARKGIGLLLANDGEWQTINVTDGNSAVVSSSENYRYLDAVRKANFNRGLSSAMGYFEQVAKTGVELAAEIQKSKESDNGGSDDASTNSGNTSTKNSRGKSGPKCKQCGGNGKCSGGTGSSAKYHCHGSKKCGWCNGDGYNYTAGNPVKCSRCKGKGVCSYCKGTGLCTTCKGTGRG